MTSISYLTNIEFGVGVLQQLEAALASAGIRKPMIVTDTGIVKAGIWDKIATHLSEEHRQVIFTDTPPNPTEQAVEQATALYCAQKCDGMIAIGGGSPLDLAKAVAVLATHEGPLSRYAGMAAMPLIKEITAPFIAIPTTAGTGSEVGRGALICLHDGQKKLIVSPYLLPKRSLCDPDLTEGMPPVLTAGTGMDAFTHCIETFLSPRVNPPAEAIALDGAARAWKWIEMAVKNPTNKQARWEMMMAGIEGGLAFQKGLGAVHALSHPLGALTHPKLHHGTVNAVILPAVLRFNEAYVGDKYVRLRVAFGLPSTADLAEEIEKLNVRIGMPTTLRELQVSEDVEDFVVEGALSDHSAPTNPRGLTEEDVRKLFKEAMG